MEICVLFAALWNYNGLRRSHKGNRGAEIGKTVRKASRTVPIVLVTANPAQNANRCNKKIGNIAMLARYQTI